MAWNTKVVYSRHHRACLLRLPSPWSIACVAYGNILYGRIHGLFVVDGLKIYFLTYPSFGILIVMPGFSDGVSSSQGMVDETLPFYLVSSGIVLRMEGISLYTPGSSSSQDDRLVQTAIRLVVPSCSTRP
jgi:hypothetical protein